MSRLFERLEVASWTCFALFSFVSACACSLAGAAGAQSQPVRIYTEDDGLPSSIVYGVKQAPDGRIWVASRSGLAVYDGAEWFPIPMQEGLPYTGFAALELDSAGDVWVVPSFGHLIVQKWDGVAWHLLPVEPAVNWRAGEPLVFATGGPSENPWVALGTPKVPLLLHAGGRWRSVAVGNGAEGATDSGVPRDGGQIKTLVATHEAIYAAGSLGLFRVTPETSRTLLAPEALPGPILGLATEAVPGIGVPDTGGDDVRPRRRWWLVGDGWVARFEARIGPRTGEGEGPSPASGELEILTRNLPHLPSVPGTVHLEADGRDGLFVMAPQVGFHLDSEGRPTGLGTAVGLATEGGRDLEVDREGLLWVAGVRGVSKLTGRRFTNFGRRHGLLEDEVTAIEQMADGSMVLGHNGGLTFLRPSTESGSGPPRPELTTRQWSSGGELARVMDLAIARDGELWAAITRKGLLRLGADGSDRWYGPDDGLGSNLCCVAIGPGGQVWAAGNANDAGRTLFRIRDGRVEGVALDPQPTLVRRLTFDTRGRLLVLSRLAGLFALEPGAEPAEANSWRHFRPPESTHFFTVLADRDGRAWLGGLDGLYELVDGRIRRAAGVGLRRPVYALTFDDAGELWLGTDHGVYRRRGSRLRHYGIREGLAGRETNRDGLFLDATGRLWIGTHLGASRFEPRFDRPAPRPRVVLEELDAEGFRFGLEGSTPVILPTGTRTLIFRYRSPSYYDEDSLRFAARLEGFETEFPSSQALRARQIRYTSLPPGEYRLHMRARLPGGAWGPVSISPPIRVAGPLWRRGWFLAALGLGLLGLVGASALAVASRSYSRILADQVRERTLQLEASTERLSEAAAELRREVAVRRRTEAQLREAKTAAESASSAKSRFLATMSHEIRTPLSGALGMIALLERSRLDPRQREHMGILRRSVESLLGLLDGILDYSKIEADRLDLEIRDFDPRPLLQEVVALFDPEAEARGIELRLGVAPASPERVRGDAPRLRQVLTNLIGNAIKFTESGSVVVSMLAADAPEPALEIRVADTGIGIPPDELETLFEPFRQVDSSHRRRFGGTGLGLAICDRLVRAMNGTLGVQSRLGEGSCFSIRIPLAGPGTVAVPAPDSPEQTPENDRGAEPETAVHGGRPLRVLIVEDNAVNQLIVREMLAVLGHGCEVAENGMEALERLEQNAYDLVLMDVQMPLMDGLEASRRIVDRWGTERPRIVALTAHALRGDRQACLEAGMDEYLTKPVSFEALEEVLAATREERRSDRTEGLPAS